MTKRYVQREQEVEYKTVERIVEIISQLNLDPAKVTIEALDKGTFDTSYQACLVYSELETDEEYYKRLGEDARYKSINESHEREMYEKLKQKYGN